ncbi:MAG: triosephosphate isomerase [Candidatus Taylorbacteria bacterium]|nr:triosephosphate isomerase [Candidatus Taylorbacteria bacterium]
MSKKKKMLVANWKMNPGSLEKAREIFLAVRRAGAKVRNVETVICPPAIFLQPLGRLLRPEDGNLSLGAQNAFYDAGRTNHTGEISMEMIRDAGAEYLIIGHSERRKKGESDETVNIKLRAALEFSLTPILCVGEEARDGEGLYLSFVKNQIEKGLQGLSAREAAKVVIAYEPVFAIGKRADEAAKPDDVTEMVIFTRRVLSDLYTRAQKKGENSLNTPTVLYGGSVAPPNAAALLAAGVGGFLVGRESLRMEEFAEIQAILDVS